jgi:hypothetical protein
LTPDCSATTIERKRKLEKKEKEKKGKGMNDTS